jgi:steroid delta-isomerase-like uncharacterized protein
MRGTDLIHRSIDALNRRDPAAYAAGYVEDAVVRDPFYPGPLVGRGAIEADIDAMLHALPDLAATVGAILEDGPMIAAEVTITGTYDSCWVTADGELPPTGRRLELCTFDLVEVDGRGRYTRNRRYYDVAGVLAQLGITG